MLTAEVHNLLNPCNCRTTGRCRCCSTKATRSPPRSPPRRKSDAHAQVTDSLIEMFKAKATTSTAPTPSTSCCTKSSSNEGQSGSTTPLGNSIRGLQHLSMTNAQLLSPDNRQHPAHTSPFVHKARLYSPYTTNGQPSPRHGKNRSESVSSASSSHWPSSSVSPRPPPPRLRPLTDMNKFLGAVFHEDGTLASEIPRSALGLPGIHTFVAAAQNGGAKVEPMEMDVDAPVAFPTSEEVVIGTCTCGDGCECAGCATHGNPRSPSSPKQQHGHDGACGEGCKSCFDCGEQVAIPSGVDSIEQLIQIAASAVPKPPRAQRGSSLDGFDTRVLPPAAAMSEDVARAFGVVPLKPLECCNGRCQCSPGECKCDSECCGCCTECKCDNDGDAVMADGDASPGEKQPAKAGCCGSATPAQESSQQLHVAASSGSASHAATPVNVSPVASLPGARVPSPSPGTATPPNGSIGPAVRRTSSVSRAKEANSGSGSGGRRMSASSVSSQASVHRSMSIGTKPTSKSLAINTHHNRPILPKPISAGPGSLPRLVPPRAHSGSSRQPSPVHRSRASSQASSQSSPAIAPVPLPPPSTTDFAIPPPEDGAVNVPNQPPDTNTTSRAGDMTIGVDDIASALAASDVDFMTYINQLISTGDNADGEPSVSNQAFDVEQAPDSNLLNAFSGATPRAAELEPSLGDIQELIAGALAQQGVIGNQGVSKAPDTSSGQEPAHEFNYFFNLPTSVHADMIPSREQQMANYQISTASSGLGGMQQPIPDFATNSVDPLQFDGNFFFTEYSGPLSLQVPSIQGGGERSSISGEAVPAPMPMPPPAPVQMPASSSTQPDIIDLSKPLNSSDIDRIMQALLNQQARQAAASSAGAMPSAPISAPIARSQVGSVSDSSDPFQQYTIDTAGDVSQNGQQQQHQSAAHAAVLPQHPDREWLQKAWVPNLLGEAVQRE